MRHGRAQPCHQRRARPLITLHSKRIHVAKLKLRYIFAESDRNTLELCLKGVCLDTELNNDAQSF